MKRRYVALGESFLTGPLGLLTEGRAHDFRVSSGLPQDAILVGADYEPAGVARLWFAHPSFEADDPDELTVICSTPGVKHA